MPRLLSVHAHPDDEASKGAPTVARYVAEGHEALLVCATGGEEGDILNKKMDTPEVRANLAAVRATELERSVKAIGYHELVWLGYRDSGMPDSEANANPDCFAKADLDEATGRLVAIIRRFQPDVIITYSDDQQGYRHPDHLRVHDVSALAFDRAADPAWYRQAGDPWQPKKMYYSVWSRARLLAHHEKFNELGLESPYDDKWFTRPSSDDRITTKIDIGEYYSARREALLAHATQVDPEEKFWFGLPDDAAAESYPWEDYILARSTVPSDLPESDLFAGVQ
ncbi:MAG: mycothiol conjugate amidase Mca [Acidimicrobiales bacterium]